MVDDTKQPVTTGAEQAGAGGRGTPDAMEERPFRRKPKKTRLCDESPGESSTPKPGSPAREKTT